ncbi:hypothetical protein KEJ27_00185 [Candidatus Bathyarchaeota archaeon]|nr:hypothetical protein [Candidatus Bathyarchaeota archaeon]MBS7618413.1 hypothetical protein [Candidatus Bathyarchaeota archaeon]
MRIIVDERERDSGIPLILKDKGVRIVYELLEVGDYVLSSKVAFERKTLPDFIASIFDGRLFKQIKSLKDNYEKPVLLLEGDVARINEFTTRTRAVLGAMSAISLGFEVPVLYAYDKVQSAEHIYIVALKLHRRGESKQPITVPKTSKKIDERIKVLTSLPGMGPTLAERTLESFGSLRRVFNASITELMKVKGLNQAKAEAIYRLINSSYTRIIEGGRQTRLGSNLEEES